MKRKGIGIGLGQGYKNILPMDKYIHSLSARGIKSLHMFKAYNVKNKQTLSYISSNKKRLKLIHAELEKEGIFDVDKITDKQTDLLFVINNDGKITYDFFAKGKNIPKHIKKEFFELTCQLSPENLTCDGELSSEESNRKYKKLMKRWSELEKSIGRTITEQEAWQWYLNKELKAKGKRPRKSVSSGFYKEININKIKEGDFILGGYPDERAKWYDETYESNLKHSVYKVLKINPKSVIVQEVEEKGKLGDKARLSKEKWLHRYSDFDDTELYVKKILVEELPKRYKEELKKV
jgi:hypothetical protein